MSEVRKTLGGYARLMSDMQPILQTRRDWDRMIDSKTLKVYGIEWENIDGLLMAAVENKPVAAYMKPCTEEADVTIICDASAGGWAAVCVFRDGSYMSTAQRWNHDDHLSGRLTSSVTAEPAAAIKAVCWCVTSKHKVVRIITDHAPMVAAANASERSFALRCEKYEECLRRLKTLHPHSSFVWHFVPGKLNAADGGSRGEHESPSRQQIHETLNAAGALKYERGERKKRKSWMV